MMVRSLGCYDQSEMDKLTPASAPGTTVLLTRLAKLVSRRGTEEVLGMRLREAHMLSYLRDHPSVPQQDLAGVFWIDANNLVLLLNDLEADGLIQRRRDPSDRRRHIVDLTPAGQAALARVEQAQESLEDEVLATLSPDERATLRKLLIRALEGGSSKPANRPAGLDPDTGSGA
jgi:DNA-binding MarR family transcriptional regulator